MKKFFTLLITTLAIAAVSAVLLGAFAFYTDYQVDKANNKSNQQRIYREIKNLGKQIVDQSDHKKINDLDKKVTDQGKTVSEKIDSVGLCLRQLTYVVTKNNKDMKKTLDELNNYKFVVQKKQEKEQYISPNEMSTN